jgi:hypothetical protein
MPHYTTKLKTDHIDIYDVRRRWHWNEPIDEYVDCHMSNNVGTKLLSKGNQRPVLTRCRSLMAAVLRTKRGVTF